MIKRLIPALQWIPRYQKKSWAGDISAGFAVGVMLIPQGMAYALIAGLPPVYGLYTALVPNLVYAFLGSSRILAVGPVALDSLILAAGMASMNLANPGEYLAMALFLAFFVGILQLAMGFMKFGFLADFLSRPVVSGFTSAAGLVIAIGQLRHVLGIQIESLSTWNTIKELFINIGQVQLPDLTVGVGSISLILLLKRINKRIPAAVVVVTLGIVLTMLFCGGGCDLILVGTIPEGLPHFNLHSFDRLHWIKGFPLALTLAFISFAEAMTMAKAMEEKRNVRHTRPNQELRALGVSNIIGSFFQSFPSNAGLSRTAVNVEEGAQTGMASIISVLVVGATLLFLTPYFKFLPTAVLGAIVIVAVFGLVNFKYPKYLFERQKGEFFLLLATFLATLLIGISQGIALGVIFSLLLLVHRTSRPHIAVLGRIEGTDYFRNINRFSNDVEVLPHVLIIRFDGQLYFANAAYFRRSILRQVNAKGDHLRFIIINAEAINYMDSSAVQVMEQLIEDFEKRGITVLVAGAIGPLRDILNSTGLVERIGHNHLFVKTKEAYLYCTETIERTDLQKRVSKQSGIKV